MIISHKHKFIFIAVPKTGTHTIRNILRPFLDDNDIEQCSLFEHKKSPFEAFQQVNHGHFTAQQIKEQVGDDIWNSYYKFAFVRNPYDRFLSAYFFLNRRKGNANRLHTNRLKNFHQNLTKRGRTIHIKPQHDYLCDSNDEIMVDYVGTVEKFDESVKVVLDKLGLNVPEYENKNVNKHIDFCDDEYVEFINKEYAKDFECFGYKSFEKLSSST